MGDRLSRLRSRAGPGLLLALARAPAGLSRNKHCGRMSAVRSCAAVELVSRSGWKAVIDDAFQRNTMAPMRHFSALSTLLRGFPALRSVYRRWHNPDLAALERSLSRRSGFDVLQPWTTTAEDRYPDLFDQLAALLSDVRAPRVLSYGCAGGEEVRALRRRLPNATIVGVDVNPRAIERARRRDRDKHSRYMLSDRPPPGELFDAVLALAVFRHGRLAVDRPAQCTAILPFSQAAKAFDLLNASLRPSGMLAWGNAHFRLCRLPGGESYDLIRTSSDLDPIEPAYGQDDRRTANCGDSGGIYRKRS